MVNIFYSEYQEEARNLFYLESNSPTFNTVHKTQWFDSQTNIDIVEGIDRVKHITGDLFLGYNDKKIGPLQLSNGCKGILLMYNFKPIEGFKDHLYSTANFGDNCFKYIWELPQDININLLVDSPFLDVSYKGAKCDMWDVFNKKEILTFEEYAKECFLRHKQYRKEIENSLQGQSHFFT